MSLRDKILQAPDLKSESMDIEEWGVTIEVRSMNGTQRARMMKEAFNANAEEISWDYASLIIAGAYNPETDELIFTEADREELNEKHGGVLEQIALRVLAVSGLSDDSLRESEKNF
jgi:hypothetical protein